MFDIGWSEMAIIMLLALIIIGPKDLPRVARTIGQWVRKGRMLAREFQNSLDDMVRDTELEDVKKEIEKVGRTDFKKSIENTIDPKGELTKAFDTSTDDAKPKPALTDKANAVDDKKAAVTAAANGHASGMAASSGKTSLAADTAKSSAAKRKTTAKTTKSVAKAGKSVAKPASARPAAAKKPSSSAKRPAKPASSAAGSKAKRSTAKASSADPAPVDEGGSADQAAVAAKSS